MQPTEGISVQRRSLDVEDYIDIVRRHKGWIFGPFLFCLVASVVGVYLWPDSYVSRATVRIVPQRVPESMVQSAVNQQLNDRINAMAQEILSRSVLTTIIKQYNLYPRETVKMTIEDVVEDMRLNKIKIAPVANLGAAGQGRNLAAFTIEFSYQDRNLAQKVVSDLVTRFIDASVRNRTDATYQTTQFMKDEMEQAKKELDEVENKLTEFRVKNNGHLPDQVNANMQQLSALQAQISMLSGQISRDQSEKLQLENSIAIFKDRIAALGKEQPAEQERAFQQKNEKLAEVDREIQTLENQLALLRQHYLDTWPDVQNTIGRLNLAKSRRETILKEESAKKEETAKTPATPVTRPQNPQTVREIRDAEEAIRRIESQVQAKDMEMQDLTKQLGRANEAIKGYQGRIETVPVGERQYGELIQASELARAKYVEYEGKLNKAQIAADMDGRKQGELLELLDPASLPINPTQPNRPMVISMGAGAGLLLGIVIAGALEMKDTSLKNLKDVRAYTQMAILGSIPLLENDFVVRRRKRLAWLGWTTACLASLIIMAGSVVYYFVTKV